MMGMGNHVINDKFSFSFANNQQGKPNPFLQRRISVWSLAWQFWFWQRLITEYCDLLDLLYCYCNSIFIMKELTMVDLLVYTNTNHRSQRMQQQ